MQVQEYIRKTFEISPVQETLKQKKLTKALREEAERLNAELNRALKKREILLEAVLPNPKYKYSPEALAPTRKALESASLAMLPFSEHFDMKPHLAQCFYSVSNLYQEELLRAAALCDKGTEQLQDTVVEDHHTVATYITCGCLAGTIINLEKSLQLCSESGLRNKIHQELFTSKSNFLMACFGVMAHEIGTALSPLDKKTQSVELGQAEKLLSQLSPPDHLSDSVRQGLQDQLLLISFLIVKLKQSNELEMSANDLAVHLQSLDHWMNAARMHLIGLAHQLFEGIFQRTPSNQAGTSHDPNAWHERVFKVCLDAVDALDYLLSRNADGSIRTPSKSLPTVCQLEASEAESVSQHLDMLDIGYSSEPGSESRSSPADQPKSETGSIAVDESVPTSPGDFQSELAEKADKLLNQRYFVMADYYQQAFSDHMPETVFNAFENDCKAAGIAIKKMDAVAQAWSGDQDLKQKLTDKINELKARTENLRNLALRTDYLKCYKFPQARHWTELIKRREVNSIRLDPKPIAKDTDTFYELEIRSKPTQFDQKGRSAWLHIHVHKALPRNTNPRSTWEQLRAQPRNIQAAHLKSDYYRQKGRQWEQAEMAKGNYNNLVKRAKATEELLVMIDHFIQGSQPPAEASTSHSS